MATASNPNILPSPSVQVVIPSTSCPSTSPIRPTFHHRNTQDRLREGTGLYVAIFTKTTSNLQKGRRSVFKEMGLDDDYDASSSSSSSPVTELDYASPGVMEAASPSIQSDLKAISFGK